MIIRGSLGAMRRMAMWIAVVAAGELLLLWLGSGALAAPQLSEPSSWPGWLVSRSTDAVVLALIRLGALWAGAYLLAVLAFGTVARALRWRPLIRVGDMLTPPSLRGFLDRATGVAAAGTVVVASFTAGAPHVGAADVHQRPPGGAHGPPITLRGLAGPVPDRAPTTTTTIPMPPVVTPAVEAMAPPPPATVPPAPPPAPPPPPEHPPAVTAEAPPTAPAPPAPGGETWTVRGGDNFWTIAHRLLADAWGRPPSARETDPYWRALVEANRSGLVDPGNPDLLLPGQVLAVPPPPARAA